MSNIVSFCSADTNNFSMSLDVKSYSDFFRIKRIVQKYFTEPKISCKIVKSFLLTKKDLKGLKEYKYFIKFQIDFEKIESVEIILQSGKLSFNSDLFSLTLYCMRNISDIIKWVENQINIYMIRKVFEC